MPEPRQPLRVLGYPTNGSADELALHMLAHLVDDLPIAVEVTKARLLASELVSLVQARGRLDRLSRGSATQSALQDALSREEAPRRAAGSRILVGGWGPPTLADESTHLLREAGASLVASTLAETRALFRWARGDSADAASGSKQRRGLTAGRSSS